MSVEMAFFEAIACTVGFNCRFKTVIISWLRFAVKLTLFPQKQQVQGNSYQFDEFYICLTSVCIISRIIFLESAQLCNKLVNKLRSNFTKEKFTHHTIIIHEICHHN